MKEKESQFNKTLEPIRRGFRPGFTLVEVLTVLFVIAIGLISVLSLIVQNIKSQSINKNSIIAYQLAQEGLELARNVRDNNWRDGSPTAWNDNLSAGTYYMDYSDSVPQLLSVPAQAQLYQNADGYFVHGATASSTIFSRTLRIEEVDANSIRAFSLVSWNDRNLTFNYEVETLFYDWR